MLDNLRLQRQRHGLKRYLERTVTKELDRRRFRIDRHAMVRAFREVGLYKGVVVCVHSSLSSLGFVDGGPDAVIDALAEVVGPEGCILMPAYSTGSTMAAYIESGEVFDVRNTASCVGAVSEVFRKRPGVLRSLHPTNSLTALGAGARELLSDHEKSVTPYGRNTPWGRMAERDDAFILMLETHIHSLLHHLQERVQFPNLYLPGQYKIRLRDQDGRLFEVSTRVMRPRAPYFVAVPSGRRDDPDWVVLHDFALMFPSRRRDVLAARDVHFGGYSSVYERRADFEAAGVLRARKLGKGEIGLLSIKDFLARIEPELIEIVEKYRHHYLPEQLATFDYY